MNILLCSAGRRVVLVQYFKEELKKVGGIVVAVDCDPTAPALHFADKYEIVPRIDEENYMEKIFDICSKYEIKGILSLIDPELSILAKHKKIFEEKNIVPIISNVDMVNCCYDKFALVQYLKEYNIPVIPTYLNNDKVIEYIHAGEIQFPLFIKPRFGSASIGIQKIVSMEELLAVINQAEDMIIQPYMTGDEYGCDCYVDLLSKNVTNIFCKKKIKMRAGETDKSIAIKDEYLFQLIENVLKMTKLEGPIDIDCFKTKKGYVISEVNPRFGGGYPHAHESGQNFVKSIINNLHRKQNERNIGNYMENTTMIKYDNILFI